MPSVTVSQADGPTHCRYNKYHLNCKFAVVDLTAGSILWRLLAVSLLTVKMKIISRRVTPPLLFAQKAPTMMNATRATSAVREPTADELAGFNDLNDILTWAAIKGDPGL